MDFLHPIRRRRVLRLRELLAPYGAKPSGALAIPIGRRGG
jgi:hypothetical protein